MDRGTARLLARASLIIAGLAAGPVLLAFISHRSAAHSQTIPSQEAESRPRAEPACSKRRQTARWSILALVNAVAVGAAVGLCLLAFGLLHQPGVPPAGGYASLLVPGSPYDPTDQFRLDLVTDQPGSTYVEYHVTAGCGTRAHDALLVLSGDARLADPRYAPSADVITRRHAVDLAQPLFPVPVRAEVFEIQIRRASCPRGVSPGQLGSAVSVGGWVHRPFEASANSAHALRLPVIGDEVNADSYVPSLRGYWAAPINLTADAYAGALPLYDQVGTARPELTGSGGLTWSGHSYIIPTATWTDEAASGRNQLWILLIGAVLGILGAIPATTILDAIHGK